MGELLLEIGTEEIPSGYLENGINVLRELAEAFCSENSIKVKERLSSYGTPRRLVLFGKDVAEKQDDKVEEVVGPPRKVAYDKDGLPTKAAEGFAARQSVAVEDLNSIQTPKGEYVYVKKDIPGKPTREILAGGLPKIIADIPWPKSMRWGRVDFVFTRPIHWILALFDGQVIPFEIAGVRSGNCSRGHRFMAPATVTVAGFEEYLHKMRAGYVVIGQREREERVKVVAREAAESVEGAPAEDPELVATVANLVEYPSAVCGGFDVAFLELPAAVLITSMKEHQKYFAVYDAQGTLMPYFVAVNNTIARDESVVRRGHERVLRARLSDAAFFFREDRKRPLKSRLEDLKNVIYQADLGTSYAKVQRFSKIAEYLAEKLLPDQLEDVKLAARLCKCDLVTQMVGEFPVLQGIMGKEYAKLEGYPEEICRAIYEHHLPARAGGELPGSEVGAIVGIADRMDTIAGCFAVGLEPTGTADPFALRRHALAVIRILEHRGWAVSLPDLIAETLAGLGERISLEAGGLQARIKEFFRERYKQMVLRKGYQIDLVEAVISAEFDRIPELGSRIEQMNDFLGESEDFAALTTTFKRVVNILKKQKENYTVDASLFTETCESELWELCLRLKDQIPACSEQRNYDAALKLLVRLRKPVDDFFEGVEILTKENPALRENRVAVLQNVARLFLCIADFSKFSG
jgi:glycyl-tRNA synthetase beta chain